MKNTKNKEGTGLLERRRLLIGMTASALSGILIAASMPNFDLSFLGLVALVPLLIAIEWLSDERPWTLAVPFGLIWSVAVHNWYADMFGPVLGWALVIGVGFWYAALIGWGIGLQRKLPPPLKLLALPVLWTAFEFVKYVAPIVNDWWFVLLAKSQWRFPPALQILKVTGFPGLSFLLMLANVALAHLLWSIWQRRSVDWMAAVTLGFVTAVVVWGAVIFLPSPQDTFTIAATTDMVNQDPAIQVYSKAYSDVNVEAPYADTDAMSQAIFDINAELTRSAAEQESIDFVVWPENEFADADDEQFIGQLGGLAREIGAYIVADVVWRAPTGMHDTALMVGPNGKEVGRRAKINTTGGEEDYGFNPGPHDFSVINTPYGKVGLAVCWDRHRLWITRELARTGAEIVLMPVDDDFNHNRWFPAFHASDSVFRAVENGVSFGQGSTNGISLVVDPYGRIVAEGDINERSIISGKSFILPGRTLYNLSGDWFGWLMVIGLVAMIGLGFLPGRKNNTA